MNINKYHVALGADTSNLTGRPWYVGDLAFLTASVITSTATASRVTFVGSNDDGLQSALGTPSPTVPAGNWSIVTTVVAPGIYGFSALGFRWINVFRNTHDAVTSVITVALAGRT